MADALLVLNAGSSSIKFSVFAVGDASLTLDVNGQIDGLTETARFEARDAHGTVIGERGWPAHVLDHDGATAYLLHFIDHDLRVIASSPSGTGSCTAASASSIRSAWMRRSSKRSLR